MCCSEGTGVYKETYEVPPAEAAGYLGRFLPTAYEELANPSDIRHWSGDDTLRYLSRLGFDSVGSLLLGDEASQLFSNERASPNRQCLVKFTPHMHQVGRRLSDMIVCEHLAREELRAIGMDAVKNSNILVKCYNFDRTRLS